VFGLVLKEGAILGGLGVVLGLAVAAGVTRLISSLLFGVEARDPVVFASVAGIFLLVTMLASDLPARRATRVDPLVALREE
jgi:putative ABC transport system permease protein